VGSRHQEVTHLGRIVRHGEQVEVVGADVVLAQHAVADPVDQAAPVVAAQEHDRELDDLVGLDQGERLPELVHGAEAAGEDHEPARVADEHDLANEEVVEVERDVAVGVAGLLVRQLDREADRQRAGVPSAAVGRLHQAGAAARDDRHARLADRASDLAGELVVGVVGLRARGAEEAGGGADLGEALEPGPELLADARDPVLVRECRPDRRLLGGDDLLVQGPGLPRHGRRD